MFACRRSWRKEEAKREGTVMTYFTSLSSSTSFLSTSKNRTSSSPDVSSKCAQKLQSTHNPCLHVCLSAQIWLWRVIDTAHSTNIQMTTPKTERTNTSVLMHDFLSRSSNYQLQNLFTESNVQPNAQYAQNRTEKSVSTSKQTSGEMISSTLCDCVPYSLGHEQNKDRQHQVRTYFFNPFFVWIWAKTRRQTTREASKTCRQKPYTALPATPGLRTQSLWCLP